MILVVEGPRCSGKTTFTQAFEKEGFRRIKITKRGEDPLGDLRLILDVIEGTKEDVVFDRFHFTEFVMSLVHNRIPRKKLVEQVWKTHARLVTLNVGIIILTAPSFILETRRLRLGKEEEMDSVISDFVWATLTLMPNVIPLDTFQVCVQDQVTTFLEVCHGKIS